MPAPTQAEHWPPPLDDAFGAALRPALAQACDGRLGHVEWFRTDWQRGGALTGYASYRGDDDRDRAAVVKLPVPPQELEWLRRLQPERHGAGQVVPALYASGREIAGYDLAWVVMERLTHGPLDAQWEGAEWELLIEAAGRFYAAAAGYDADGPGREEDWEELLKRSRAALQDHELPERQRWSVALKSLKKLFKKMRGVWDGRDAAQWCHGDLHPGNAMTRSAPPGGPAFVFDLARVHTGHWVEDAVYLEHLFWARRERLGGRDVAKLLNAERKRHGLGSESDWPRLADIRRALRAAAAPAEQAHRPDPAHLHASLVALEQVLPRLG